MTQHPNQSIGSRRASQEFIPGACSTPRRMPSPRSTSGDDSAPPFRPSAHPRGGVAYPLPRLSAVGCLTSFACAGLTPPSADCCGAVRGDSSALSPRRGHPTDLPWSAVIPSVQRRRMYTAQPTCGWRALRSRARSPRLVPPLVSGACPSPRTFVPRVLQTPPRGDALALPFSFGSTYTWTGDFHPRA